MTKDAALYQFFNNFGIEAYPKNKVPDDTIFPWMTYELSIPGFGNTAEITCHLYYHTESEDVPNSKAEDICASLRHGGKMILCDGGALWIKTSSPEWYSSADEEDSTVQHRIINLSIEDLTI